MTHRELRDKLSYIRGGLAQSPSGIVDGIENAFQMSQEFTEVVCKLTECLHHHSLAERPGICFCSHKDKPHYLNVTPCPLYKLDLKKKTAEVNGNPRDFLALMRKRR